MKIKKITAVFMSVVLTLAIIPFNASAEETEPEYVEGEILITSKKDIEDSKGRLFTASDDDTVRIDFDDAGIESIEEINNYTDDENIYKLEVEGDVEKICDALNENEDIIAEPNYILHTCSFTMPSEIANNKAYYPSYQKWYYNDIMHIPDALQKYEVTGAGVTIAVIDDGFYPQHGDLDQTKLWKNSSGTIGWNTYANNDDISPIYRKTRVTDSSDPNYNTYRFENTNHGSNVAGIIGMKPNGSGGIGAAYGATLMLLQAANYNNDSTPPSFTSAAVASAIDFARENGADIINLSLGSSSNNSTISNAITRAYNAGIIIFAAAGNNGYKTSSTKYYPAANPNVIGVMAIDKTTPTKLASFSNYDTNSGQYYDIAAPGVSILGCSDTSGSYTLNNGTSQASPLCAAAAALYLEKNPGTTPQKFKEEMLTSATEYVNAYNSTSYRYKSLNVYKLLDYCIAPEITVNLETFAVLDGNYLYGLDEGFENISDYLTVTGGTMTFVPSENGNGTGSIINVYYQNGNLFRTINVIIFGDVNGDCVCDGQDAVIINFMLLTFRDFTSEQRYAADVTNDGIVGIDDEEAVESYGLGIDYISQSR